MPIDGVKIKCIGTHYSQWEKSPLLSFSTKVDTETGEIKSQTKIAFYRGLYFLLIPSTISSEIHCIIRGSLPRYYNQGRNNAFDYTYDMLEETVNDLSFKFHLDKNKAIIQHFEYGVNVECPITPKNVIQGIRAYQSDVFTNMKTDEVFSGKQIQKQEYRFKIYDKSLQIEKPELKLLRIEIAIKSRKKAAKYGIKNLSDLLVIENLRKITPDLLKIWDDAIFYDKGMKWRKMTRKQKEKMLYYLDATNWIKFTRKQRSRAKIMFLELKEKFCSSTTQNEISNLITKKIQILEAKKGHGLRNFKIENESQKRSRFTDLNKGVKRGQNQIENYKKVNVKKSNNTATRKCIVCGKDISDKRLGAIFCCKKHNNSYQAKRRRKKRRQLKSKELKDLSILLKHFENSNDLLKIKFSNRNRSISIPNHKLKLSSKDITKISKVKVNDIVLTSYRARKLIKTIIKSIDHEPEPYKT